MNVTKLIILTVLLLGAIGLSLQKDSYEYRLSSKATEPTHEHLQEIILKTSNRLQELSSMDAMAWVSREDGTGYDSVQYLRYKLRRKLDSAIKS